MVPEQVDAAYGTALITAMGIGALERSPEALDSVISMRRRIEPNPIVSSSYETMFKLYRQADEALRSVDRQLGEFERAQKSMLMKEPRA